MNVKDYSLQVIDVDTASNNYDESIESIIYKYRDVGSEVLAIAGESIDRIEDLYAWVGYEMLTA
ncbi:MAG TPA: hypothetical protein VIK84_04085 [Haloplasmataceae bacterium]